MPGKLVEWFLFRLELNCLMPLLLSVALVLHPNSGEWWRGELLLLLLSLLVLQGRRGGQEVRGRILRRRSLSVSPSFLLIMVRRLFRLLECFTRTR